MQRLQSVPTQLLRVAQGGMVLTNPPRHLTNLQSEARSGSRGIQSKTPGLEILQGVCCHLGEGL